MGKQNTADDITLRLSTRYEIEMDLDKPTSNGWRKHLARAIISERVFRQAHGPTDRVGGVIDFSVVAEEITFLLATTPPALKDAILYQIFYQDVLAEARRLDRKVNERL